PTYELIIDDQEMLTRFYDFDWDPRQSVLLEEIPITSISEEMPYSFDEESMKVRDFTGQTQITSYTPNEVKISYMSTQPSILVLSDSYYDSWKAYLDGEEVPIMRANYVFRGMVAPAGDHEVVMKYRGFRI